jgi:Arc/MetJ-type ribon-helix-helix transcriptional regulator
VTRDDHDLTSMTVSLPASQKEYVREQAAASGCSTPSEYIRRLIHADQETRQQQVVERKLLEGLGSPASLMSAAEWRALRATLKKRLGSRKRHS